MVDDVLRGIAAGDFAVTLLRAAAFARIVAAGRAALGVASHEEITGCWRSPSSSRPPVGWKSPTPSPERLKMGECAGPWQPRVPQLAATSGHAP